MNELEYRAGRARHYRKTLNITNIDSIVQWCIHVGLWETASWTCHKQDILPTFKWLDPGERRG